MRNGGGDGGEQLSFAVKQTFAAGDVDQHAIRRINRDDRREPQRPSGQRFECQQFPVRLMELDQHIAARQQRPGVGKRHCFAHTGGGGLFTSSDDNLPAGGRCI